MSLHTDWDDAIDDMLRIASLPVTAYNVYESISQKHPNMKIIVRCGQCAGAFGLVLHHFQTHHFKKGASPSLSVNCPNSRCGSNNNQHDMDYVRVQSS